MQFVINNWYLFLGLVVILGLLAGPYLRELMYGVQSVSPSRAVQLLNHHTAVLIDVREVAEFEGGHIGPARNYPLSTLSSKINELEKFKDKPVVLYCRSGQRSAQAAVQLHKHGFAAVYNLSGGIMAWQGENLPVEK